MPALFNEPSFHSGSSPSGHHLFLIDPFNEYPLIERILSTILNTCSYGEDTLCPVRGKVCTSLHIMARIHLD
jgi:hypothetical protein